MAVESTNFIERVLALSRDELMQIAVARGCRHYASFVPPGGAMRDDPELLHEVLGAALLRGPEDAATFQAIRCGAMVLSDLGNSAARIAAASEQLGVAHRVAHVARLGLLADDYPHFWDALLRVLPVALVRDDFLPGVSRLTSETRVAGPGRFSIRTWLRTQYVR